MNAEHLMKQKREVTFLLVDDDEVDRRSVTRSFEQAKLSNPIIEVDNGLDALKKLRGEDGEAVPRPCIVLLDLNMPRMSGLECLREIRQDSRLKKIVVFILTTSNDDQDKKEAHELNVTGYIVKADAGKNFMDAIAMIDHYWRVVEMPNGAA